MNEISHLLYNTFTNIEKETYNQTSLITDSKKLKIELPEIQNSIRNRNAMTENSKFISKKIGTKIKEIQYDFYLITFNVFSEMRFSYYIYSYGNISSKHLKQYGDHLMFLSHFIYDIMVRQMNDRENQISFPSVHVHIYMTGYKKLLPNHHMKLNVEHVNTGLTEAYSETGTIIIFRKEEWYKTTIHELLHLFGVDQYTHQDKTNRINLLKLFNVNSKMLYGEAYVEFWANTLQCAMISFHKSNRCFDMFKLHFETYLSIELQFSLYQANKILNYMSLTYVDLFKGNSDKKIKFNENTNVFCYYILKAILLYYHESFFIWCIQNNTNYFKLKKHSDIYQFFYKHHNKTSFVKTMDSYMNLLKSHQTLQKKRKQNRSKRNKSKKKTRSSYAIRVKNIKKLFKYNTLRMTILDLPNEI